MAKKKVARNLTKAVQKKKAKKIMSGDAAVAVMEAPKTFEDAFKEKKYKVLYEKDGREIRIYPPVKRTVLCGDSMYFMQMPYMVFARVPKTNSGSYAYLFGCFATEDLSEMTEDQRNNATVYRMPFPYQLDHGMWGPCCLLSGHPWYTINKNLDGLIERFWLTSFRGFGDYGQKSVTCWHDMSVEQVFAMLKKSTPSYKGTFAKFVAAVQRGTCEDY